MMGGESKQKGKTPSTLKRRRSPSPASSGSAKASATPSGSNSAGNKRKSVRPATLGKKFKGDEDSNDLTRDMEDPPSDTNLREVEVPKVHPTPGGSAPSAIKKDADWLPTKGNHCLFLDIGHTINGLLVNRCCPDRLR